MDMKHLIYWSKSQLFAAAGFLATCAVLASCSRAEQPPQAFTAAMWNVQALFDGEETGNEFRDFSEAAGWTAEKYSARITAISQAILQMPPPDIIGFLEVENASVLADLAGGSLAKYGYNWTAFSNIPGAAFGLGFLSRFPIEDSRAHSITVERGTAPRPILEVRIKPAGEPLVFLLCHWKSKLGNSTEVLRRASARVVQRRLRELRETEPETPVIVMGDLNENHDEFFRKGGDNLNLYALLPDDPGVAELATQLPANEHAFLVLSSEKPPRSITENIPALYSPWGKLEGGSYYFRGGWETIDHFLLGDGLFDGEGWDYSDSRVLNIEPFITSSGTPNSYIPRSGRGLSDHLPLLLYLQFVQF